MTPSSNPDLVGRYAVRRAPFFRRLAMEAFGALDPGHPMLALIEVDVTAAEDAIAQRRAQGERLTLFAFLLQAIAATLAEHSAFNAVRSGLRIFEFEDVDVSVPVEVDSGEGRVPLQLVVRRVQAKSAAEIYAEIESARARFAGQGELGAEDRTSRRLMRGVVLLPAFVRRWLLRRLMGSARAVKRWSGTTLVTAVGKFATTGGFVIPLTGGPRATSFALGSVVRKPVVVDGEVVIRSMQSLTVVFDHALVDGGPAARFVRRLQERIESAEGLGLAR
jgi:pyruvate/2-oxoglutarate dehydrogenase complex dihydrolipoamide acyltransferase (E2) component